MDASHIRAAGFRTRGSVLLPCTDVATKSAQRHRKITHMPKTERSSQ